MEILLTMIAVIGGVTGLLFLGFSAIFLTEHLHLDHQEHLEDYEEKER